MTKLGTSLKNLINVPRRERKIAKFQSKHGSSNTFLGFDVNTKKHNTPIYTKGTSDKEIAKYVVSHPGTKAVLNTPYKVVNGFAEKIDITTGKTTLTGKTEKNFRRSVLRKLPPSNKQYEVQHATKLSNKQLKKQFKQVKENK